MLRLKRHLTSLRADVTRPVEPAWQRPVRQYAPVVLIFCLLVLLAMILATLPDEFQAWMSWRAVSINMIFLALGILAFYLTTVIRRLEAAEARQVARAETLALSKERLDAALNHIQDGVISTDVDGLVTVMNTKASELTGWGAAEAVGRPLDEVFRLKRDGPPGDEGAQTVLIFQKGQSLSCDRSATLQSQGGGERAVHFQKLPVLDDDGWLVGMVLIIHDVTELRAAERQRELLIRDLEAEIGRREAARRAALSLMQDAQRAQAALCEREQRLRESNAALEEYARVASHDLQEPLRKIQSFAQVIMEDYPDRLDEQGRRYLTIMADSARRMRQLIKDVLAFSRAGTQERPFGPVDLNEVLVEVRDNLSERIRDRGAAVDVGLLPTIHGDRTQMVQLFQNLVGNGLKFNSDAAPRVEVTAEENRDHWRILVRDNGIGMNPEETRFLFAPFKRLHGAGKYEGTGIGLAICRRIVNAHGGVIDVETAPGRGSTFHMTFPKKEPASRLAMREEGRDTVSETREKTT